MDEPPIRVQLRRAAIIAIPVDHPSIQPSFEVLLDAVTLQPSPKIQPQSVLPTAAEGPPGEFNVPMDTEGATYASQAHSSRTSPRIFPRSWGKTVSISGSGSDSNSERESIHTPRSNRPRRNRYAISDAPSNPTSNSADSKAPTSRSSCIWPFDAAFSSRRPIHVPNIPDYVVEGFDLRGWGEPAREAVVIPITVDDADLPVAVLILGLNSRRPYDADYEGWIELTRLSLNSLLTAVKGREADLKRAE